MPVGRKKKHNKHLPRGVTHEHGAYYFRGPDRKRVRLGSALGEALAHWATIIQPEPGSITTLHDAFERYKLEELPKKAPKTQTGYLYMLPGLDLVWGRMAVTAVKPRHGYQLLDDGAKTPTQALKRFNLLSGVLTKCVKWGVIDANPFHEVDKEGYVPPARERCPTDAEYAAVYSIASERLRIAMELALLTGLRKSAILRLELGDVTEGGLLSKQPGKRSKALLFEWTDELRAVVTRAQRLEPRVRRALLCTGQAKSPRARPGQHYTEDGFQANWGRLMDRATATKDKDGNEIEPLLAERFHFHDIRAKSATDDADEARASRRLGHATIATTQRIYIRGARKVTPLRKVNGQEETGE
jgi:integrase